jgi:Tol biopolymer transport system component
MQHWLPYDEHRLYMLLGIDRGDVWHQLRDDTKTLADLAWEKLWDPRQLAHALILPWRNTIHDPRRLAVLEHRALRTLTQGHLAQHLFFHSLHQDAIPDNAPAIFGVASREEFAELRRSEFSPLQICRLDGVSRAHAQTQATTTLVRMAERGVRLGQFPASQAKLLLTRQLNQLPRWLQQTRYNGPPPLVRARASPATAANYSTNASLSHDGRVVAFEAYDAKLATVKRRGEISVKTRRRGTVERGASTPPAAGPRSTYNPAISADGRWIAFESAAGNLNFGKRYGQIRILLRDLRNGLVHWVSHRPGLAASRSAYNATISGDGQVVAFEAYEDPGRRAGGPHVFVFHRSTHREEPVLPPPGVTGDPYEPTLSNDGGHIAFTVLAGVAGDARSEVFVQTLATEAGQRVSRPGQEAWEPVLSADGRVAAYTATELGGHSRVIVRDLRRHTESVIRPPEPDGWAYEPSLSADGTRVAFVARPATDRRSQVYVTYLRTGTTELVSRATGADGPAGAGSSTHPSISGDGRRVAYTSDSWNLSPRKCNSARGVFVRDLPHHRTALVSLDDGENRYIGPTRGSSTGEDAFTAFLCG